MEEGGGGEGGGARDTESKTRTPHKDVGKKREREIKHLSVHQRLRSAIPDSTTNLSYRFPIFETSATALCGTTGTSGEYY